MTGTHDATDAVSALLAAAESLRATARGLETIDLPAKESRDDLRALLADIRRTAFMAVTLGALELTPTRAQKLPEPAILRRRERTE